VPNRTLLVDRREKPKRCRHIQHATAVRNGDPAVLRTGVAEGVLVKQRDMLSHPYRFEADVLGTPAEIADHPWRRQRRHEGGKDADLHVGTPGHSLNS
jgi:hypothetical protein